MKTKLQIALDDITLEDALLLLEKIQDYIDIAEVGTPFMMEYGMKAVRRIKSLFPKLEVLCDAKIMDAGGYEANLAFAAGADYVTVLGVTDDLTISDCAAAAAKAGKKVMADLICVSGIRDRVRKMEAMGVDVIGVHTGVDQQAAGRTPLDDLKEVRSCVTTSAISVAGGINTETIDAYLKYRPEIIIVGGGISRAKDPAAAAKELSEHIKAAEISSAD